MTSAGGCVEVSPGPPRDWALPGRRDTARSPAWCGGADPERTAYERPSRPDTRQPERAGQAIRDGTERQSPGDRVRFHTEEVTGSIPVSPTTAETPSDQHGQRGSRRLKVGEAGMVHATRSKSGSKSRRFYVT
jgi:hypothetical protein